MNYLKPSSEFTQGGFTFNPPRNLRQARRDLKKYTKMLTKLVIKGVRYSPSIYRQIQRHLEASISQVKLIIKTKVFPDELFNAATATPKIRSEPTIYSVFGGTPQPSSALSSGSSSLKNRQRHANC